MKRWLTFGVVFTLAAGALALSQARRADAPVGPYAILHFIADTERELGRLPFAMTRLSDADEIRLGDEMAPRASVYAAGKPNPGDAEVATYVERVGSLVMARAQRPLPYRFHYLPNRSFVNAFALPGGHVYIGGGLIALMDSEDELAAVLGHEIAHVDLYHCAERVQIEARLRKLPLGVIGELAQLPILIFQAGYSKTQEFEADRVGLELAVRASYSPYGDIRLFEKFQSRTRPALPPATPQEEAARVAAGTLEGYFRSHPFPEERIAEIRRLIAQNGWENRTAEKPLAVRDVFHPAVPPNGSNKP